MLNEIEARRILYFRALNEVDNEGILMKDAGRLANEGDGQEVEQRLADHFLQLERRLADRHRLSFEKYYAPHPVKYASGLMVLCFLVGLGTNYLGSSARVNLLHNPLMVLFAWNLLIYLYLVATLLIRGRTHKAPMGLAGLSSRLVGLMSRFSLLGGVGAKIRVLIAARLLFLKHWLAGYRAILTAGMTAWLHLLAAALVVGVIGGLYLRGLTEDYSFTWASTFIEERGQMEKVLGMVFAPIALILGGLPPLEGNNGAAWIHFLAVASLLYVLVPRLVLFYYQRAKARRLSAAVSLDVSDPYFLKLLQSARGERTRLVMVVYSYTLGEADREGMRALAGRLWGNRLSDGDVCALQWGASATDLELPLEGRLALMVVFNGAQTPEEEMHQVLLDELNHLLETRADGSEVVVMVDPQKLNEQDLERRRSAWYNLLGKGFAWLKPTASPDDDGVMQALTSALGKVNHE